MVVLASKISIDSGLNISQLPIVGCAPEWMSEKAVSIGNYVVATGIDTFLGVAPQVTGGPKVTELLTGGIRDWVEAAYTVETDIEKLGDLMIQRIEEKRKGSGNLIFLNLRKRLRGGGLFLVPHPEVCPFI